MTLAIEAVGLVKRFGKTLAVDGVDLAVRPGMVLGLLGPNGAGKTTVVRMLATLLRPDAGYARVCGADIVDQADRVRELIGLTGQYAAVDEDLTGFENLLLIGRLLEIPRAEAKRRSGELLERFGLADAAGRSVKTYSGGMRRRLDLAASLVQRPQVLFLDEPTTGLDPRSRGEVWAMIRELVVEGTTVLLTTQYLDEADRLASEIAVIDHGRVIATGTAAELKAKVGRQTLDVRPADPADLTRSPRSSPRSWASARPGRRRIRACCPCPSTMRRYCRPWSAAWRPSGSKSPSSRCGWPAWTRYSWRSPGMPPRRAPDDGTGDRAGPGA